MFPLGREAPVAGHHGPFIGQQFDLPLAEIDHRLDGEDHAGFEPQAGVGPAIMQDLRFFMEFPADAVPAILAHDRTAPALGQRLDAMPDRAEAHPGPHHGNGLFQALVSELDQAPRAHGRRPHQKHLAGVAVVAVLLHGHVDIDDVAVLQSFGAGDAVTDHMIDRGADRFGEAAIIERGGDGLLLVDDIIVAELIKFARGDAAFDPGADLFQHLGREPARHAHLFDFG